MEAIRRAAAAAAHHRHAVAALHHRPAVAALHHRPAAAALHHRPDVAALHRSGAPISSATARVAALHRSGAPISSATARVAALHPSGAPIYSATALHRSGAPISSATARLPILRRTPPCANFTPRRLSSLSQATAAKIRSEILRVDAARTARFDLTSKNIDSITSKVHQITESINKPKYDASLDLRMTSLKVCGIVFSSGLALALVSFSVMYFGGGQGAKSAASLYVDARMEEVKDDLLKKILPLHHEGEDDTNKGQ